MAKQFDNHLGVGGWIKGGRYGIERYLYILQRLSGVGLILYLMLHVYETSARINGAVPWETTMGALEGPVFKFFEWVVYAGFAFHALNGLRLVLTELGYFIGKPGRVDYPFVTSVHRQRPLMWVLMVLVLVFIVAGIFDIFVI